MNQTADIVICGAGITGVAAAHFLSRAGAQNILLVDERPPLSLTSDRSTEGYRNWWPDAEMLALMNRSIDLMEAFAEESGNIFRMNRRGYLYVTADEAKIAEMEAAAHMTSSLGAGPLRVHSTAADSMNRAHGWIHGQRLAQTYSWATNSSTSISLISQNVRSQHYTSGGQAG
jgi:glycine/D-amino acid oxidase-like deaminating enzyme